MLARTPSAARLRALMPPALLVLGGLLLHLRELLGERPVYRDLHAFYVPAKLFLARTLAGGEWPQWWPWDGAGAPYLAQPMFSVFHPSTLLYVVLPFWGAFVGQILVGVWLAALGAYVLARTLDHTRERALLAGAAYAFCGYVVTLGEHTFMHLAAGTMPWYLAALVHARTRRGPVLLLPALALGLLLLAGDPQIAILSAFSGVVLALAAPTERRRALILSIASPCVAGLLAAVQLLPALSIAGETERAGPMAWANRWPLEPHHLLGFASPLDFGASTFAGSTFVGIAVLALASASLVRVRRREVAALWVLAIVSLWLALGDEYGLNALARRVVPFWSQLRYPMKSSVLLFLALALLAAEGARCLVEDRRARVAAAGGGLVALAAALGAGPVDLSLLARVAGAAAAVLLLSRPDVRARWTGALVASVQLLATTLPLVRTVPPSFYDPPPEVAVLREAGVGLFGPSFEHIDPRMAQSIIDPVPAGCIDTCLNGTFELPSVSVFMPGGSARVRSLFQPTPTGAQLTRLFGLFGVGALVLPESQQAQVHFPLLASLPGRGEAVVAMPRALPRAYAVHRARAMPDAAAARAALLDSSFKPGREILVEDAALASADRPDMLAVPVQVRARTNSRVELEATLPWPGYVVLNEAFASGWSAEVDGREAPLLAANVAVRAVPVDAGAHRILFRYRTPGLALGATLTLATLAALVFAWILLRRQVPSNSATLMR